MADGDAKSLDLNPEVELLYRSNRVVTLPSRGRMSVKEHVLSKSGGGNGGAKEQTRARSLSAGRSRIRPDNLVQDIYDRMGVSFKRGSFSETGGLSAASHTADIVMSSSRDVAVKPLTPKNGVNNVKLDVISNQSGGTGFFKDKPKGEGGKTTVQEVSTISNRYRITATTTTAPSRGRSAEVQAEPASSSQQRTQSLPRAIQRWPPAQASQKTLVPPSVNTSGNHVSSRATTPTSAPNLHLNKQKSISDTSNSSSDTSRGAAMHRESPSDEFDAHQAPPPPPPRSLKERISAYTGNKAIANPSNRKKNSRNVSPAYASSFANRDHPPKIDIYSEGLQQQTQTVDCEEKKEDYDAPPEMPVSPARSTGTAQSKNGRNSGLPRSVPNKTNSNMAEAFLAKITGGSNNVSQQPSHIVDNQIPSLRPKPSTDFSKNTPPVMEIAAVKAGNDRDDISVEMSTISDDFINHRHSRFSRDGIKKAPMWQDRGRDRLAAYNNSPYLQSPPTKQCYVSTSPSGGLDSGNMNKIIEERVQSRLAEAEARMETKFRSILQHHSENSAARIAQLETTVDNMSIILERLMQSHPEFDY